MPGFYLTTDGGTGRNKLKQGEVKAGAWSKVTEDVDQRTKAWLKERSSGRKVVHLEKYNRENAGLEKCPLTWARGWSGNNLTATIRETSGKELQKRLNESERQVRRSKGHTEEGEERKNKRETNTHAGGGRGKLGKRTGKKKRGNASRKTLDSCERVGEGKGRRGKKRVLRSR